MKFTKTFAVLATLLPLVLTVSLPSTDPTESQSDGSLRLPTISDEHGDHSFKLTGTFDHVMAELKEHYPEVHLPTPDADKPALLECGNALPPLCVPVAGWNWGNAYVGGLNSFTTLLNIENYVMRIPPECQVIWCNDHASVWICNNSFCFAGGQVFDNQDNWNLIVKGSADTNAGGMGCPPPGRVKKRSLEIDGSST
ncbi:uncharacterized protein K444DRAFT_627881 [Hyaloscypha bicolor E]|uniref:Uncharacterized protein n=1 Tax=Hyaloscypha bicolor E TaxID=1095630 RepID=A0A2J6TJ34_9HELO|nr:uncharacterized protein K444DRAFT_627881 [Hyaloscypha bicolor E]PMD63036.1 hypothetical protein K444DRAFT_627881 [Hyaloscypha bicolor E]